MPLTKTLLALAICATLVQARAADLPALPADADAAPAPNATLDTVSVIGQGESRQVQRLSADDMKALPPGSSPLKALDILPGVHFESADPFGAYEWSTRISLRGFN